MLIFFKLEEEESLSIVDKMIEIIILAQIWRLPCLTAVFIPPVSLKNDRDKRKEKSFNPC